MKRGVMTVAMDYGRTRRADDEESAEERGRGRKWHANVEKRDEQRMRKELICYCLFRFNLLMVTSVTY